MPLEKICSEGPLTSFIQTASEPEILERISRHRGLKYTSRELGGDGGFIADTAIKLRFNGQEDSPEVVETCPLDRCFVPGHKLGITAHFFVEDDRVECYDRIVLSGRIVPMDPVLGLPMEWRDVSLKAQGYDLRSYTLGHDPYLQAHGLAPLYHMDCVEIGRLCRTSANGDGSHAAVLLAFKALHQFLETLGITDYFCAAIDEPRSRYASLYEGLGMRKIGRYSLETVTGFRREDGRLLPTHDRLTYWAQHMNIPHTQARIRRGEFGIRRPVGGARLNRRLVRSVGSYLTGKAIQLTNRSSQTTRNGDPACGI